MRPSGQGAPPRRKHAGKRHAHQQALKQKGDDAVFSGKRNGRADCQQHGIAPNEVARQQHVANATRQHAHDGQRARAQKHRHQQVHALECNAANAQRAVPPHVEKGEHERLVAGISKQRAQLQANRGRRRRGGMRGSKFRHAPSVTARAPATAARARTSAQKRQTPTRNAQAFDGLLLRCASSESAGNTL